MVEPQLFVCSTQAWARRGRRSPRYRADGAHKGRGGGPERSAAWPAAEAGRADARAPRPPGEGRRGCPAGLVGAEEVIGRAGSRASSWEAAGFWLWPLGGRARGPGAGEDRGRPRVPGEEEELGSEPRQRRREAGPFGRRCGGDSATPSPAGSGGWVRGDPGRRRSGLPAGREAFQGE